MNRQFFRITVCAVVTLASCCFISADDAVATPPNVKPPRITLRAATTVKLDDQPFSSLTLEVVNPNSASLTYTGYAPDSFDPQLKQGHIVPLFQIELQRDGKWEPYPVFRECLFGVTDLELTPKSSSTFDVAVSEN